MARYQADIPTGSADEHQKKNKHIFIVVFFSFCGENIKLEEPCHKRIAINIKMNIAVKKLSV